MTHQRGQHNESLTAEIIRLEQRLEELLAERPIMDDEVNAVERDLRALRALTNVLQAKIR